jgi:hypothetical protein
MTSLLADPWVKSQIDRAVAPYVGRLPEREIAWMREELAEILASDERAAAVLRGAMPREVDQSGDIGRDEATSDARSSKRSAG